MIAFCIKQLPKAMILSFFVVLTVVQLPSSSYAGTLQVEPVLVDVAAPQAAATLTLRNEGSERINAQIRVFRWYQADGHDKYEPTDDVVASPPAAALAPNGSYLVRIVRVTKRPVSGEESYRLIVDQLPNAKNQTGRVVNLLIRHSIPVFFAAARPKSASVSWSIERSHERLTVTANNSGESRLRIAALNISNAAGKTISFGNGLIGYVLGHSVINWTAPASAIQFVAGEPVSISAQSNAGPINARASVIAGR